MAKKNFSIFHLEYLKTIKITFSRAYWMQFSIDSINQPRKKCARNWHNRENIIDNRWGREKRNEIFICKAKVLFLFRLDFISFSRFLFHVKRKTWKICSFHNIFLMCFIHSVCAKKWKRTLCPKIKKKFGKCAKNNIFRMNQNWIYCSLFNEKEDKKLFNFSDTYGMWLNRKKNSAIFGCVST